MSDSQQAALQHDALADLVAASRMPRNASAASLHSMGGNDIWNASHEEIEALSHRRAGEVCPLNWLIEHTQPPCGTLRRTPISSNRDVYCDVPPLREKQGICGEECFQGGCRRGRIHRKSRLTGLMLANTGNRSTRSAAAAKAAAGAAAAWRRVAVGAAGGCPRCLPQCA